MASRTLIDLLDTLPDAKLNKAILAAKPAPKSKINSRRYDVIAYRYDASHRLNRAKKPQIFSNLSAAKANAKRIELRKDGCYRVDKIEVISKVNGEALDFDGNHKVPEKVMPLVTPNPEPIVNAQKTMPWDIPSIAPVSPAYLPEYSNKVMDTRKEHAKAEAIRSRSSKSYYTRNDYMEGVKIYRKSTSTLIFSGNEAQACFFMLNNKSFDINDSVVYVNGVVVD